MIDFQQMIGASPNPYMVIDRDFRLLWANRAYERATMRSLEDIRGAMLFDAFPPPNENTHAQLRDSIQRAIETGEPDELAFIEYAISNPDGGMDTYFWSATHTPFRDASGTVAYVLQHTVNITELETLRRERDYMGIIDRARAVESRFQDIADEAARLRNLFEQAPGFAAVLSGPEHRFVMANASYRRLVGERDIVGLTVAEALPEVVDQGFVALLDQVYASGAPYFGSREKLLLSAGPDEAPQLSYLEFVYQPLRGSDGAVSGIFVQGYDVTEEVEAGNRQRLLINELNHRVKNTLAIVQGLARQSFGRDGQDRFDAFDARLGALAGAHNLLTERVWEPADLHTLVRTSLEATAGAAVARCELDGPAITLQPQLAVAMAMVVHELSTNAIKYGALSDREGKVTIRWTASPSHEADQLVFRWTETGGPAVSQPEREGFGSRLIRRGLGGHGKVRIDYLPEGLHCCIEARI